MATTVFGPPAEEWWPLVGGVLCIIIARWTVCSVFGNAHIFFLTSHPLPACLSVRVPARARPGPFRGLRGGAGAALHRWRGFVRGRGEEKVEKKGQTASGIEWNAEARARPRKVRPPSARSLQSVRVESGPERAGERTCERSAGTRRGVRPGGATDTADTVQIGQSWVSGTLQGPCKSQRGWRCTSSSLREAAITSSRR